MSSSSSEEEAYKNPVNLGEFEEKYGISWLSACYPLDPEFIRHPPDYRYGWRSLVYNELRPLVESQVQEYPNDSKQPVSGEPCPSTDVLSLLGGGDLVRNNGDRVPLNAATFEGKYVLVCCFHVPVLWGTQYVQTLLYLCNKLYSVRDDFEMVVVARMIGGADKRPVFDHFFSCFHDSVLAVPYEDSKRRHHISNLLDLGPQLDYIPCVFISADGSVLPPFLDYDVQNYGADAFPFTEEIRAGFAAKREQLLNGSLEQLLRPYESSPDDVSVYKFNDPREVVNVSELGNKHVGLYVCIEGTLIPGLNKMYKECKEKQLDFEIVVLYIPCFDGRGLEMYQEEIDNLLEKEDVCGWWCLPFNNSVSRRFMRLTRYYHTGEASRFDYADKLIAMGPGGEILDMYEGEVIKFGRVDAYPFTRMALVDAEMKKLREITLESVLVDDVFRGNDRNDVVSANELLGKKKVIVYLTSLRYLNIQELVFQYHEMKASEGTEFELVLFVKDAKDEDEDKDDEEEEDEASKISEMPWYVYPRGGTRSVSTTSELLNRPYRVWYSNVFLGFGEDGRLNSYRGDQSLDDTLWEDVLSIRVG